MLKGRLSPFELIYHFSFAIRVAQNDKEISNNNLKQITSTDKTNINDKWLHPAMTIEQVQNLHGTIEDLKYCCQSNRFVSFLIQLVLDSNFVFVIFLNRSMHLLMINQHFHISMNK